jgi:flagellar basal body-associated protein FliL
MAKDKSKKPVDSDIDDIEEQKDETEMIEQQEPEFDQSSVEGDDSAGAEINIEKPMSSVRPHHRLWHWVKTHKKVSIPAAVVLVIVVLAAVPFTRYALASVALKQTYQVTVVDDQTKKPVTSATVELAGKKVTTDSKGKASLRVKVGNAKLTVEKKYYKPVSQDVLVPILKQKKATQVKVHATGRQVPITVINKITSKPVANVKVTADGAEVKTDSKGQAVLVLPADKQKVEATITASNYNSTKSEVTVTTEAIAANTFSVTPAGKVYFLSNQSGNIDVVKTNLDGTDRQTVLAGTGKEDKGSTVLLASRDWKYLALYSKRDGGEFPKLFLITTANDKVVTMDEGDGASFSPTGWDDHKFVYLVTRTKVQQWENNKYALKSYNAESQKITTLDQTVAQGDQANSASQNFEGTFLLDHQVVYAVDWSRSYLNYYAPNLLEGKSNVIRTVQTNGQGKKDVKTFDATKYGGINTRVYEPNSVAFATWNNNAYEFYEYENGEVKKYETTSDIFFGSGYATHLISPSGNQTFWAESRDGQQTLFVGDKEGKSPKQVAANTKLQVYGWFTDEYLLAQKDGSELYILPVDGLKEGQAPLKVTNYYRPDFSIYGYGGGYGGL